MKSAIVSTWQHLKNQPFVTAAAIAALVHSCWTFSVFFAGESPTEPLAIALWLIPGILLALAIDVGLLAVSTELKEKGASIPRLVTFVALALFMGYAQFLFSISHAPNIAVAAGVRPEWREMVITARDASIFVLPIMLPLAIILHSLDSGDKRKAAPALTAESIPEPAKAEEKPAEEPAPELPKSKVPEYLHDPEYAAMLKARREELETSEAPLALPSLTGNGTEISSTVLPAENQ